MNTHIILPPTIPSSISVEECICTFCENTYTVFSASKVPDALPEAQFPLTQRDLNAFRGLLAVAFFYWVLISSYRFRMNNIQSTVLWHSMSPSLQYYWYYLYLFTTDCWIKWKARSMTIEERHELSFTLVFHSPTFVPPLLTDGFCPNTLLLSISCCLDSNPIS